MRSLNDFPTKVLKEVFSYLDFETLTRCMRVNKSFKAITEHSAFDKIFFRTKAIKLGESIDLDQLQINPIFRKLTYMSGSEIQDAYFLLCDDSSNDRSDTRKLFLTDSSAAKQNATDPAVTCLYLSPFRVFNLFPVCWELRVEHSVTVHDIIQALSDYYTRGLGRRQLHRRLKDFYALAQSAEGELVLGAYWES
jgi:hypothetical protein